MLIANIHTLLKASCRQKDTLLKTTNSQWNCAPCLRLKTLKTTPRPLRGTYLFRSNKRVPPLSGDCTHVLISLGVLV